MPEQVLDDHYFGLSAIVTVGMQLVFFFVAYFLQIDKVTDFAGSTNFSLLAVMTLVLGGVYSARQIILTVMVLVSRSYLAGYLLYRVLSRGRDARFDEMRTRFFAFLGFWVFQMIWAFGVMLPVIYVNSVAVDPELGARDWAGIAMFVVGLFFEIVGDLQKQAFRSDRANNGRVCDAGVWSITRHPNYFGEILLWWGVFTTAAPVFDVEGNTSAYATILSPILTMIILLFLSGMPTAEGDEQKRFMKTKRAKAAFMEYRNRTPPLIPFIPAVYNVLPLFLKRVFCCEFRMYECDYEPADDGAAAVTTTSTTTTTTTTATAPVRTYEVQA